MRALEFSRSVLSISVAAALLSACAGGSSTPVATDNTIGVATGLKHHQTFSYTGTEQTFSVPAGVTRLSVIARGGQGAGVVFENLGIAYPGRVYAIIRVHPREKLYVFVGGAGTYSQGGFNGGGAGGDAGAGGGGASDVRSDGDKLKDRIIVAAGGGGVGYTLYRTNAHGGDGGGLQGQSGGHLDLSGSGTGGAGGTQDVGGGGGAGGRGYKKSGNGTPGGNGMLGLGGAGGNGGMIYANGSPGGGGGAGYYGGGGGGGGGSLIVTTSQYYGGAGGGGGGGSSYVEPSAITSRMWTGWKQEGNGRVIFSW